MGFSVVCRSVSVATLLRLFFGEAFGLPFCVPCSDAVHLAAVWFVERRSCTYGYHNDYTYAYAAGRCL
jgi:hypothetical protein